MSDEAELLASASQRVGTVLHGKYRIDGVLGVGGMATVYAATHRNRKRFAIKVLHPELSVRRDMRERFVREGYVANSVDHPGVVVILDDDVDETGSPFLVMELLEGVTVDALCGTGPVPIREALGIVYRLLDVLDAAHRKAVIHRDVKPANLFLARDGQLKVVDFGIARLREAESGLKSTRAGAALGTPAFMAPEQAKAAAGEIDARTDIWAVGATLFTMLSARFVHEGDNARQIMIRAATEPARSLADVAPGVPPEVVAIVSRALQFERAARWESAAAMRDVVLDAHRKLFGEPSDTQLRELVERAPARGATLPTEASPESSPPSRTTDPETRPSASPRIGSPPSPAEPELESTPPALAPTKSAAASGSNRRLRPVLALAGAAFLGLALFALLTDRSAETTSVATQASAQRSPQPTATATASSLPSEPVAPQPSAPEAAPPTSLTAHDKPPPRSSTPTQRARKAPRSPERAVPSAAPAPARAPGNPLQLELQ